MKIILSRKGFDSTAGGVPSPIFPDDRMLSLPIPDPKSRISYQEIRYGNHSLGDLVSQLTRGRVRPDTPAHIDPDLAYGALPRMPGWKPIFGQQGAAQSHLRNNQVGPGDLFLFFGLFRRVVEREAVHEWKGDARPCHVIWGWMQVGEVVPVVHSMPSEYRWAEYHPHFNFRDVSNNVVYLACRDLKLGGRDTGLPGAGVFDRFAAARLLTDPGSTRVSDWLLPAWIYPKSNRRPLTYHADMKRWTLDEDRARLRSASRGQEFVLDCDEYPEAMGWVADLVQRG